MQGSNRASCSAIALWLMCFVSHATLAQSDPFIIGGAKGARPAVCPRPVAHLARQELAALAPDRKHQYLSEERHRLLLNLEIAFTEYDDASLEQALREMAADRGFFEAQRRMEEVSILEVQLVLARWRHDVEGLSAGRRRFESLASTVSRSDVSSWLTRRRTLIDLLVWESLEGSKSQRSALLRDIDRSVAEVLQIARESDSAESIRDFELRRRMVGLWRAVLDEDALRLAPLLDEYRKEVDESRSATERLDAAISALDALLQYASIARDASGVRAVEEAQRRIAEAQSLLAKAEAEVLPTASRALSRYSGVWALSPARDFCVIRAELDESRAHAIILMQSLRGDDVTPDLAALQEAIATLNRVNKAMSQQPKFKQSVSVDLWLAVAYRLMATTAAGPQKQDWLERAERALTAGTQRAAECFCGSLRERIEKERSELMRLKS
ncbi:hypothetical protein ACFPN2_32310 [Steroidobacter flavus]|uniref:Uncharacterized protein n=1 Tax=Steroidobacter flavus TaxID=1842136 RepID=A0ABV8T2Z0_9GAMM